MKNGLILFTLQHLLGDYYFQSNTIARKKGESLKGVAFHGLEFFMASLLVLLPVFSGPLLIYTLLATLLHVLVDGLKYGLLKKKNLSSSAGLFFADQLLHMLLSLGLAYALHSQGILIQPLALTQKFLALLPISSTDLVQLMLAVLLLLRPCYIALQIILAKGHIAHNDPEQFNGGLVRLVLFFFARAYGVIPFLVLGLFWLGFIVLKKGGWAKEKPVLLNNLLQLFWVGLTLLITC